MGINGIKNIETRVQGDSVSLVERTSPHGIELELYGLQSVDFHARVSHVIHG